MKKTVRTFVFLMILLLCLAVFAVACETHVPDGESEPPETPNEENFVRDIIEYRSPYDGAWFSSLSPEDLRHEIPATIPAIIEEVLKQKRYPATAAREILREEWAVFRVSEENSLTDIYLTEDEPSGTPAMELHLTFGEDGAVCSASWIESPGFPAHPSKIARLAAAERVEAIESALAYDGIAPQDTRSYIRTQWKDTYARSYGKRDFYIWDVCDCEEEHKQYLVLIFDDSDHLIEAKIIDET
ncbi:MAG: hypothetical protein IJW97_07825 [Clostridia bacterium]|nr:hypothetical protein [Clostridia bacterium]